MKLTALDLTPDDDDADVLATPEQAQQLARTEGQGLLDVAKALVIDTPAEAQGAADLRNDIKTRRQKIWDWFVPMVEAAHKAHKALTTKRGESVQPYDEPLAIIDQKLATYERARQAAARAAAEAAEQERQRQLEEHRLAAALKAEQDGRPDQAERILEGKAPEPMVVVVPEPTAPKVAGVAFQARYAAEVYDMVALCAAVAAGQMPSDYVTPNMTKLNQLARAQGDLFRVPGCRVVQQTSVRKA